MNCTAILNIIGLTLGALGAFIMLVPSLSKIRNINDDFIRGMNRETGGYTQNKHVKERNLGFWSFGLIFLGFILQLITALIS